MKTHIKRDTVLEHIFFHADFDGAVSAAMLLRWARSSRLVALHPVDYHIKSTWSARHLPPNSGVVDFLFHPDALIWVDHHNNPFTRSEWAQKFRPSSQMQWDPSAPCCPILVSKILELSEEDSHHFEHYIKWSITIDSGAYQSPQQATDISNPYILLSKVISSASEELQSTLVRKIAWEPVQEVLASNLEVQHASELVHRTENEIQEHLDRLVKFDGTTALFDQSLHDWPYQRYHPYLIHPSAKFVIGIYRSQDGFTVSLGSNPWMGKPHFNVGRLCEKFGGGGHAQVGGVSVRTLHEAHNVALEIRKAIQLNLHQVNQ